VTCTDKFKMIDSNSNSTAPAQASTSAGAWDSGPDATARDIVQYIARGQIRTVAVTMLAWASATARSRSRPTGTRRTQKFQREVAGPEWNVQLESRYQAGAGGRVPAPPEKRLPVN
jgi:hypothetical protein